MEFLLLVWLMSAAACGVVASAKGKSVVAWLLLGFVFGVFAFLFVAFSKRETESAATDNQQLAYDKATGLLVVAQPQPVPPRVLGGATPSEPEFKTCPFCAEEVRYQAVKCKHCQSDLTAAA